MTDRTSSSPEGENSRPVTQPIGAEPGFTSVEKGLGVVAGYQAPFLSSLAATAMLQSEADPVRRRQLEGFRRAALIWGGIGVAIAIVGFVVILSWASSHGVAGDSCRGGIDRYDPMNTTFFSTDNKHWTATYPCNGGGFTTVPVPANRVP